MADIWKGPGVSDLGSSTHDDLIAGDYPALSGEMVTFAAGQTLTRGAVCGKRTKDTIVAAAKAGGNTGDGTITGLAVGAQAMVGVYRVVCIAVAANGGTFKVLTPEGVKLDKEATVGAAYDSDHLDFTINDGATDFIVGDEFAVTVSGSKSYQLAASAAVDGSARARRVLAVDVDTTGGAKEALVYMTGVFNVNKLIFGTGHTADTVREDLADVGIQIRNTVRA